MFDITNRDDLENSFYSVGEKILNDFRDVLDRSGVLFWIVSMSDRVTVELSDSYDYNDILTAIRSQRDRDRTLDLEGALDNIYNQEDIDNLRANTRTLVYVITNTGRSYDVVSRVRNMEDRNQ